MRRPARNRRDSHRSGVRASTADRVEHTRGIVGNPIASPRHMLIGSDEHEAGRAQLGMSRVIDAEHIDRHPDGRGRLPEGSDARVVPIGELKEREALAEAVVERPTPGSQVCGSRPPGQAEGR